jgi:hypothetical protein
MKRFLLFMGDVYYPRGGWGDFERASDDLEMLKEIAHTTVVERKAYDWAHIIDTETGDFHEITQKDNSWIVCDGRSGW